MDNREAVAAAKAYVKDIYADEGIEFLGLEEIERENGHWLVTVSFSRPWNTPRTRAQEVLERVGAVQSLQRAYKVVTLDGDGAVLSMKTREPRMRREPTE